MMFKKNIRCIKEHKECISPFLLLLICINNPFQVGAEREKKKKETEIAGCSKTSNPFQSWETGQEATWTRLKRKSSCACFLHGDRKDQCEALVPLHCFGQRICSVVVLGGRVKSGSILLAMASCLWWNCKQVGIYLLWIGILHMWFHCKWRLSLWLLMWSFPSCFCGPSLVEGFGQNSPHSAVVAAGPHPVHGHTFCPNKRVILQKSNVSFCGITWVLALWCCGVGSPSVGYGWACGVWSLISWGATICYRAASEGHWAQ